MMAFCRFAPWNFCQQREGVGLGENRRPEASVDPAANPGIELEHVACLPQPQSP